MSLKAECGSTISTTVDTTFEQQATDILAVQLLGGSITQKTPIQVLPLLLGKGTVARVGVEAGFVVTALDVAIGKQRSSGGDVVAGSLVQIVAVGEGGAPSGGGGGGAVAAKPESGKPKRGGGGGGQW